LFQLIACVFFLFASYLVIETLSRQSPFMRDLIKDNLGIFSGIASDMFNDYRADNLHHLLKSVVKFIIMLSIYSMDQ
jgi:hypothetical protein